MNISAPFIRPASSDHPAHGGDCLCRRDCLYGAAGFASPQVDFPTISVSASLPGASAEIMASSVATPLERQFGHIAGVTEMTSSSTLGTTSITIQFDLSRNIDGAARDVEAAINAARTYLPANLPSNPTYRKVNPADSPIMILGLTSDKYRSGQDVRRSLHRHAAEAVADPGRGPGQCRRRRAAVRARGRQPHASWPVMDFTMANVQSVLSLQNSDLAKGQITDGNRDGGHSGQRPDLPRRGLQAADRWLQQWRGRSPVRRRRGHRLRAEHPDGRLFEWQARGYGHHLPPARRQHHRNGGARYGRKCLRSRHRFPRASI